MRKLEKKVRLKRKNEYHLIYKKKLLNIIKYKQILIIMFNLKFIIKFLNKNFILINQLYKKIIIKTKINIIIMHKIQ